MEKISQRISKALDIKGIKAVDLAKAIGVDRSTISLWKQDKTSPRQDKIYLAAKFLDISPAWLMGADVPMTDFKSAMDGSRTSEIESDILNKFSQLNEGNKRMVLGFVEGLLSQQK